MIDVTISSPATASTKCAGAITHLKPPLEVCWHPVGAAIDVEDGAGDRIRQDADEGWRVTRQLPSGSGIDRSVALESGGLFAAAQQCHHGNHHAHGYAHVGGGASQNPGKQVARHIRLQLCEGTGFVGGTDE